jgi:hypothetical protein
MPQRSSSAGKIAGMFQINTKHTQRTKKQPVRGCPVLNTQQRMAREEGVVRLGGQNAAVFITASVQPQIECERDTLRPRWRLRHPTATSDSPDSSAAVST